MISEKKLSVTYTSFWKTVTPLADRYVRLQNTLLERFQAPMALGVTSKMRGVTNELGFRIFCKCYAEGLSVADLDAQSVDALETEAIDFITRFRESSRQEVLPPGAEATHEARLIAQRLLFYYHRRYDRRSLIELRPEFPGVGILDTCAGDVLADSTLYEIKAAERSFRVVDVRQVLVYCALNYAASRYRIDSVALLNPRMGTYFSIPVEELALQVSGAPAAELFGEILEFVERGYHAPGDE